MLGLNQINCVQVTLVTLPSQMINEASVVKKDWLADEGWDDEMFYELDNGIALCFRWYSDPRLFVGQKITWAEDELGIRIFYGDKSIHLNRTPVSQYFENH